MAREVGQDKISGWSGGGGRGGRSCTMCPLLWLKLFHNKKLEKKKCQVPNTLKMSPPLFSGCETKSRLAGIKLKDGTIYM